MKQRKAYPVRMEQLSKEQALCGKRKKNAKTEKKAKQKGQRGHPKGSKNKNRYTGKQKKRGATRKYGDKLDYDRIPDAYFRGRKYVSELIKLLPEMPNELLIDNFFVKIGSLGRVNSPAPP